jgi:hypothetical protein
MKTTIPAFGQLILSFLLLTLTVTVFCQKNNTWKGGAPGLENDWNCPKNWSAYSVPDDFTNVFIPDVSSTSLSQPVIKSGKVEINAIFIASNAVLTVEKDAQLVVLTEAEGVNNRSVKLKGSLLLLDELNQGKATPAIPLASSKMK